METTIVLTMEEQKRVEVIQRVFRGELTMGEAAMVLGVTERHSYRIKARIRKGGVKGVIHGNRGRSSDRKLSTKIHGETSSGVPGSGLSMDLLVRPPFPIHPTTKKATLRETEVQAMV